MTIRTPGFEPAAQYSQHSPTLRDVLESPQLPTAAPHKRRKEEMPYLRLFCSYTIAQVQCVILCHLEII